MVGAVAASPSTNRKELQALAKQNGINANQKSSDIISQLEKLQSNSKSPLSSLKALSFDVIGDRTMVGNIQDLRVDSGNSASRRRRRSSSRSKPASPTSVLQHDVISDVNSDSDSTVSTSENINSVPLSPELKDEVKVVQREISDEIKRVDALLRSKYPVLLSHKYQSVVGISIMTVFTVVILYCWKLYYDMCRGAGSEGISGASMLCIAGLMLVIAFSAR